jgi:hypothetical protein
MLRRAGLPALLSLVGLACAVLVARLPPDFERTVVTPLNHGADPLLSAALLRFGVSSLLQRPSRYFSPPILHPAPNPLRGTEPLLAEAVLAIPFRLALGDGPAPLYTTVKIVTLALVALATGLMLGQLGVRDSLCLAGGGLAVLVATTAVFVDRLQAVSLQWLPLALLFAVRFWRSGRRALVVPLALCAFLSVQASLYTSVMLLGLAPFLVPLAAALAARPRGALRASWVAAGLALAALLSLLVLRPYLADRGDVAAYATAAYAAHKSWNPAFLVEAVTSPPEYGPESWPLRPHASWNGFFPGHAFLLLLLALGALAWLPARSEAAAPRARGGRAFHGSRPVLGALLAGLAAAVAAGAWLGSTPATRLLADALLWGALAAWCLRLALWPRDGADEAELALGASAFGLAALVLLALGLGSPIRLHHEGAPALTGLFGPLSSALPPLRELRELRRCLLPAGWAAVVGATLALERRLRTRPAALGPLLATVLLSVGLGERLVADTRKATAPPLPAAYAMLRESRGIGGLLELPVDGWGQIASIHRMLWQPAHGRPIVAGRTGLDPSWYHPARAVFNEFPSQESLRLARAWGIDSVLDQRPKQAAGGARPEAVVLRGERPQAGRAGSVRLFDLEPDAEPRGIGPEPEPPPGSWERPSSPTSGVSPATLATDGSLDTAGEITDPQGVSLVVVPDGSVVTAVELDYGGGRFARVPRELSVLGLVGDDWVELAEDESRAELRARAAHMLLRDRRARLLVRLRPERVRRLRLACDEVPWELPEIRLRVAVAASLTERP